METRSLRIGDAERDTAVSALGDHYAAGRITKDEYDERAAEATAARFDADLKPLFSDLPAGGRTAEMRDEPVLHAGGWRAIRRMPKAGMMLAIPLMVLVVGGMLFMLVGAAPWMLLILFWLWICGGGFGSRHARRHHRMGPPDSTQPIPVRMATSSGASRLDYARGPCRIRWRE